MDVKRYKQNEVIFAENTLGGTMYEIVNGKVGIYAAYGTANEKKLTELEAGRIFGEMAMIEVYPRSATAVALEDVEAKEISMADLQRYFKDEPDKLLAIMRGITRRLRELTEDYNEACEAVGEWKDAEKRGSKKSARLLGALKKFAKAYAESVTYADRYMPGYAYMAHYY